MAAMVPPNSDPNPFKIVRDSTPPEQPDYPKMKPVFLKFLG